MGTVACRCRSGNFAILPPNFLFHTPILQQSAILAQKLFFWFSKFSVSFSVFSTPSFKLSLPFSYILIHNSPILDPHIFPIALAGGSARPTPAASVQNSPDLSRQPESDDNASPNSPTTEQIRWKVRFSTPRNIVPLTQNTRFTSHAV